MDLFENTTPLFWALSILCSGTVFTILWALDAATHEKLVHVDISDKELQSHRNILITSLLMEMALIAMYWSPMGALPFFIAFFITRTSHEFIDELKFHVKRCTAYETYLHLGMWMSVLVKTFAMFIWGFFSSYSGLLDLPMVYYIWGGIVFLSLSYISVLEWKR